MRIVLFDQATDGHHLEYATWLATSLREAGDEVTFVSLAPPNPGADIEPLLEVASVRYVSPEPGPAPANNLTRLRRVSGGCRFAANTAREQVADILHFLYIDRAELPAGLGLLGGSRRFDAFGTLFWPYFLASGGGGTPRPSRPKQMARFAVRELLGRMVGQGTLEGLFVHTERQRSLLVTSWGEAVRRRIHVVPDPADTYERIGQDAARRALDLPEDVPLLLFFGTQRRDKGPDVFLEALRGLGGNWRAVMAGTASWLSEEAVVAYQRQLADPGRLIPRLGLVPATDVPRYFEAADVVVLPYRRMFLGTSGVMQRAAAAGTPVIASDVGDLGDLVREHGLGDVVEPENPAALRRALQAFLAREPQADAAIGEAALRYAKSTDRGVLGARVREVYKSARAKGRP